MTPGRRAAPRSAAVLAGRGKPAAAPSHALALALPWWGPLHATPEPRSFAASILGCGYRRRGTEETTGCLSCSPSRPSSWWCQHPFATLGRAATRKAEEAAPGRRSRDPEPAAPIGRTLTGHAPRAGPFAPRGGAAAGEVASSGALGWGHLGFLASGSRRDLCCCVSGGWTH